MATLTVSATAGDDVNDGAASRPVRSLGRANSLAAPGDLVLVEAGVYPEQLSPADSLVTWQGAVDANGQPLAKIVGDGTRSRGIYISTTSRNGITFRNFDISGQTYAAVNAVGVQGVDNNHVFENVVTHHVIGTGANQHGFRFTYGNPIVRLSHVHHIGPANESWGIYGEYTHSAIYEDNQIHDVRKEGIRGFRDRDSHRRRNRIFNCWLGIADAYSLSSWNYDNFLYWNTWGFNPKHSNSNRHPTLDAYTAWGVDPADTTIPWSRWHNNTCWDNSGAGFVFFNADADASVPGGLRGVARQVDIRNNIIGGFGGDYWKDHSSGVLHDEVVMDYNVYSSRAGDVADVNHYWLGFSYFTASEHLTLAGTRTKYGYDLNAVRTDPGLNDVGPSADYDYPSGSPMASGGSPDAGLPHGTRRGARGVAAPRATWTHRPATFVSATPSTGSPSRAVDRIEGTYWTAAPTDSSVVVDLGATVTVNEAVADVYGHGTPANPKAVGFDAGSSATGPWTPIADVVNIDAFQASMKYEWPQTVATRFLRYRIASNFGDAAKTLVAGIRFGLLQYTNAPPPPDTTPPSIIARDPLPNALDVSVTATVSATFSEDVTGVTSSTFRLLAPDGTAVPASVAQASTARWTLFPVAPLAAGTVYTASLTGGASAIRDAFGNPLLSSSWTFTTSASTNPDPVALEPGHGRFRGV